MTASAISRYGVALRTHRPCGTSKTIASCSSHWIKVCQAAGFSPRVKHLWETAISIARLTGELYV
jgi:hypothetical protein